MDLYEYGHALRKRWVLLLTCVLVTTFVMSVLAIAIPKKFSSEARLFVAAQSTGTPQDLVQGNTFAQSRVKSYVQLVRSESVLDPVISDLRLNMPVAALAEQVEATVPVDTVILSIQVTDTSASRAAAIANAIASQMQVISARLEPKDRSRKSVVTLTLVEAALPPATPSSPAAKLYVGFGILAGLALGFVIAIAREVLDRRLHRQSDPADADVPASKPAETPVIVWGD